MNCFSKLKHALLTSLTVISMFYFIDLVFLKYSYLLKASESKAIFLQDALDETQVARNANVPMVRLENMEATLREIFASHREGINHKDENIKYYQYKLGLEDKYWDNKMAVAVMQELIKRHNTAKTDQSDPDLVRIVRDYWIHPPSHEDYELEAPRLTDFSLGQSEVVDSLLERKRDGFFVECGALDGETRSNTLFFERERGWSGLLIESGPGNYRMMLNKHRQAYMTPACLGVQTFPTSMLFHKGRNRGRLIDNPEAYDWVDENHMDLSLTDVQCFPLYTFLLALNRTHIDYFSLDVEGVELSILMTIPFHKITISVLTVEFKHSPGGRDALWEFMKDKGYGLIAEVTRDDNRANDLVFVKNSLVGK